jgi:hypothetical protein
MSEEVDVLKGIALAFIKILPAIPVAAIAMRLVPQ